MSVFFACLFLVCAVVGLALLIREELRLYKRRIALIEKQAEFFEQGVYYYSSGAAWFANDFLPGEDE